MLRDIGLLILRLVCGGLISAHGAQKLFGWFQGPGLEGTSGFMESLGLKPSRQWATLAGGSEFGGGALTILGLFHPIGPILKFAPMITAIRQVHWDKPIWATEGGAELPLTNLSVAAALAASDPGRISLDYLFGIRVPRWISLIVLVGVLAGVAFGEVKTAQVQEGEQQEDEQAEAAS